MATRYISLKSLLRYISLAITCVFTLLVGASGISYASIITSSSSTVLTANLSSVLYLSNSSSLTINAVPNSGGVQCFTYDNLSFYANNASGYTLYISDASNTSSALTTGAQNLPSLSTVANKGVAGPQTTGTVNTWGYSVNPNPTSLIGGTASGVNFGSTFPISNATPQTTQTTGTYGNNGCAALSVSYNLAGMPTYSNLQIISSSSAPVNTTYTTVFYGIYVNAAQASGSYQTTIVYTLASNP